MIDRAAIVFPSLCSLLRVVYLHVYNYSFLGYNHHLKILRFILLIIQCSFQLKCLKRKLLLLHFAWIRVCQICKFDWYREVGRCILVCIHGVGYCDLVFQLGGSI